MARISLLFHPPGTRLFAMIEGRPAEVEVKALRIAAEHLERGDAGHAVAPVSGPERPLGDLPELAFGDLHATGPEAEAAHAAYAEGKAVRPRAETQASTIAWANECYPEETGDRTKKVLNLIEEVAEFSTEAGLAPARATEHFRLSAIREPSKGDRDAAIAGELGDVGIAFYDAADAHGHDADACRDRKMAVNRTRTREQCAARQAAKRTKGL